VDRGLFHEPHPPLRVSADHKETGKILASYIVNVTKYNWQVIYGERITKTIMIPLNLEDSDYSSHTCIVRVVSEHWLSADYSQSFSFKDVTFPDGYSAHTGKNLNYLLNLKF
jgi:hypothetical protein